MGVLSAHSDQTGRDISLHAAAILSLLPLSHCCAGLGHAYLIISSDGI